LAAGYRALKEGESVEFALEDVEGGRQRAVEVTGPDGKDPQVIKRRLEIDGGSVWSRDRGWTTLISADLPPPLPPGTPRRHIRKRATSLLVCK